MKPNAIIGILLLVAGAAALAYQGFTYTREQPIVQVGAFHMGVERHETNPIALGTSAAAVVGGLALIVGANRSRP